MVCGPGSVCWGHGNGIPAGMQFPALPAVNIHVFISCCFVFSPLVRDRKNALGSHFEWFGVPRIAFWWFLRVLGMAWNFDGFWDFPWDTPVTQVHAQVTNPQLADLQLET